MRKCYSGLDAQGRQEIESRLLRYMSGWPEGLSTDRMGAWIHSCTKGGGYTEKEYRDALTHLRDSGQIAIANSVWYIRKRATQ